MGKKEKQCDPDNPADARKGDNWDHVAYDPEHRMVLGVIPGKRTAENTEALVKDVKKRTGGRPMDLITTDEYKPYIRAILKAYGRRVDAPRSGRRGRPRAPHWEVPETLRYATVHKTRENGRVVKVETRVIFGDRAGVEAALKASKVSRHVNTAFVERHNGTDRNRNARKVRKTYCFSKDWDMHAAMTYFTMYTYNFCWPVRTLAIRDAPTCDKFGRDKFGRITPGRRHPQTPAMAAHLTDHVWTLQEWITFPAIQQN